MKEFLAGFVVAMIFAIYLVLLGIKSEITEIREAIVVEQSSN